MGSLKIGFVLDDTLDTPDGVQQYILTLGTWLRGQGHDVHYLVGRTERSDIPNVHSLGKNIQVAFNGNRMSTPLPTGKKKIRTLLQREKFDVLHVQIPYSPFLAHRIIMNAPAKTAVVGTFHIAPNSRSVTVANTLLSKLIRKSLRRFDGLFSVSSAAAAFALKTHGLQTVVLPNVVRTDHFKAASTLPKQNQVPTIVFLGRLVPRKGCQVLLEAVNQLSSRPELPAFEVIVCGRGPLENELKEYVSSHKLSDVVSFAGFVDDDMKAKHLKTADIAVFPSSGGESFGIVLIEAMAAEHPVVLGADNEGYASVLGSNPDALFPVNDSSALADKLAIYLTDKSARDKALRWQQMAVRQYDVAIVGRRLVARYQDVLRSRSRA